MENLLKKLQDEVGITPQQAMKAVTLVKGFMDKEGVKIDWKNLFKNKSENRTGDNKSFFDEISNTVSGLWK